MTPSETLKVKELLKDPKLREFYLSKGFKIPNFEPSLTNTDKWLNKFITEDPDMTALKGKVKVLSEKTIPVIIIGETGTGKELIAQALHGQRKGNFVGVNCAGVADTLLESEFFGAVKGSYTGCVSDRCGYFEHAKDGTLFLDEVSELPLMLQSKLLRVLEDKKYRRVGDVNERVFSGRIIAATNVLDLQLRKEFRKDLYYRLAGLTLRTKNLRDRGAMDIQNIIVANDPLSKIPEELIQKWSMQEPWVGNVRELLNKVNSFLDVGEI